MFSLQTNQTERQRSSLMILRRPGVPTTNRAAQQSEKRPNKKKMEKGSFG
jgi:hypothetical protein